MTHYLLLHGATLKRGRTDSTLLETESTPSIPPPNSCPRPGHWRPFLLALSTLLLAMLAGCGQGNQSRQVELVMSSGREPTPATTFELRFDLPMVRGDQVGLPATNGPLLISPRLPGAFTWISPRSGVFTPSEPLALGTTYRLTLRPELQRADGSRSDAWLNWTVATPSFGVLTAWPQTADTNADSEPEIRIAFNADVRATNAGAFFHFRDGGGEQIAADVRQGNDVDSSTRYYYGEYHSLRTWQQEAAALNKNAPGNRDQPGDESAPREISNLIVVTPRRPLPLGEGWRLIGSPGIPSADGAQHCRDRIDIPIGDVTPFTVRAVTATNLIRSGASVRIEFSKTIPETLTNTFLNVVQVSPAPTNLSASIENRVLRLLGDFEGGSFYTVKFSSNFHAEEKFLLQGTNTFAFQVPHVPARLYFPALSHDQMAGGNRTFPLLAINVPRVRVRAKLMDANTAIHALRGFGSYFIPWDTVRESGDWNERYRALDYNLIPGSTVYDDEIKIGDETLDADFANTVELSWDELLSCRPAGVVLLEARQAETKGPGVQALIQLTDLGLVWKKSSAGVDLFVFSQSTGQPVAGATARLFDDENAVLGEAITGTNGLAHLDAAENATWVAAQHGQDFHAVPLVQGQMWSYENDFPVSGSVDPGDPRRVMLFSDRDLYRPGETLNLAAIVRQWRGPKLDVPSGQDGSLDCLDARGKSFFKTNLALSSFGSWSVSAPLPATSRGQYSARLKLGTNEYLYGFRVEDFKPDAFELQLASPELFAAGDPVKVALSGRYFFGRALSRARVAWSLEASDTEFAAPKFPGFQFARDDYESRFARGRSSQSLTGRGVLTPAGELTISPEVTMNPVAPQPRSVSLLAEVTDVNQQTISRRVEFVRQSSDFYLGLRRTSEVVDAATNVPLEIVAVDHLGRPWPKPVKAQLSLQRIEWVTVRVQGAGRHARYRSEVTRTNLLQREITVDPVVLKSDAEDEVAGNRLPDLPRLPAGEYLVEAKTADDAGRPVVSSLHFEVAAPGETSHNYRDETQLALKPDRPVYAPGDTAEILIEAPFSGTALVTVEREKVLRSFVMRLEGNSPSIKVPLLTGDVPNVFVSVTLTRGSEASPHHAKEPEYRAGVCDLTVSDPHNRLSVAVELTATNYLPGAPVDVSVGLADNAGAPVSGAEVVLYAVDDGVLSLGNYKLPDPLSFFYEPRWLAVQSGISLPNLLSEDPAELSFGNKGFLGGGGGRERIRKNFLACAFWQATLQSDAEGKVHARFNAPDSLTRYRVFAVAHTADSRFGSAQSAFQVSKPLVIEPSVPAIANVTDHLTARAVVMNQTSNRGQVLVTLELDDKARAGGADGKLREQLSIPANGALPVEFPVEFTNIGPARWVWRARFMDVTNGFSDAVQSTISVGHIAPVLSEVLESRVTTAVTNLLTPANPQLLAAHGNITVRVANTRLNELAEAVSKLLHYPYGCAEQTGSSLLPWILLRDVPGMLPDSPSGPAGTNKANAAIHAGIARFLSMQTQSGGFAYWPHGKEPMLWASAYGGMVLALAKQHGVAVPASEFDALLKYLSHELRSGADDPERRSDGCLALYTLSLAGRAEPAYHEKWFGLRAKLSAEDRALLALAVAEAQGPAEMIQELLKPGASVKSVAYPQFGCAAREEAIRLLAWLHAQPGNGAVDRLVGDLMREQREAHWGSTQGDAWALLALTQYAKIVEASQYTSAGTLEFAGNSVAFQVNPQTNFFTQTFSFTNLPNTALHLTPTGTNALYTSVSIEAQLPEQPQPRQDRGFSLRRQYDRLDDDNRPQGTNGWQVGDRVLVTLRLTVHDQAGYLAVDDPLPAILEVVNPEFRSQQARAAADPNGGLQWWPSDFQEIRQDRWLSFADWVGPGDYAMSYLARVRAAGSVTAPSAKVEEMYHPERCGITETQQLNSEALK